MKNFAIQDTKSRKFYCVEMTETDREGNPNAGENDFPYWSDDQNDAYRFNSELYAQNEFKFNDLTCDGTREPVIVEL